MNFFDLLSTSFTNLYQRKARTLLTVLGVIIGTMSIVLMIALGEGSTQTFIEEVSRSSDLTRIEVYPGYSSDPNAGVKLDENAVSTFEQIENVATVVPITQLSLYVESPRYVADLYVQAAPLDKLGEMYSDKLDWGTISRSGEISMYLGKSITDWNFFINQPGKDMWEMPQASNADVKAETFKVYFGGSYLYTQEENGLDPSIILPKPVNGKVGGVFKETGSETDYTGYIDISFVERFVRENKAFAEAAGISGNYTNIQVYANDMNNVAEILKTIKELGYEAYSPMEYIEQMQQESARQQAQWGAVGAIALLVSAIGIINTMMTSIMERKREIGVLKVLGCSLKNITMMFLIEAAIIGMLGGMIGVVLSYGVSVLTAMVPVAAEGGTFLGSFFGSNVRFVIRPIVAVAAVIGAALIGMIAGIYPSVRAMKMPPLAALRDE